MFSASLILFCGALALVNGVAVRPTMPHGGVSSTRSTAPSYSGKYFVEGVFKIPYFATAEPITAWTDTAGRKQKVEYYGGQDTYLYRYDIDKAFEIVPIVNEFGCFATNVSGPASAKRAVLGDGPQVLPLVPDVSAWKYAGGASVRGIATDAFQTVVTNVTTFGTGVSTYTMFVASDTRLPIRLQMEGINFIMGSHPDTYVFDYHQFRAVGQFDDGEFDVPSLCSAANRATSELLQARTLHRLQGIHASIGRVVPPMHTYMRCSHAVDDDFAAFTLRHAKRYASCGEHAARQDAYRANAAFVAAHNGDASQTHTVELNQHADLSDAEYRALVLLPRDGAKRREAAASATHTHADRMEAAGVQLPRSLNWAERGGVLPPKDQGACGSCWTFGSSESLSGAWFAKYGELIDLSEQQIVDCAWGYFSSMACDGGFAPGAFSYLMKAGGIGTELSYKYLAQDGWCNPNDHSSGVTVQGYVNVTGDAQLMSALQVTPVAIAIDASLPSFRFYKHGIYQDSKCSRSLDELDHEVLAFGYGVDDATGLSYFLVRNSWSTMWGDNGDIKMKMGKGGCGVSAQATYPLV